MVGGGTREEVTSDANATMLLSLDLRTSALNGSATRTHYTLILLSTQRREHHMHCPAAVHNAPPSRVALITSSSALLYSHTSSAKFRSALQGVRHGNGGLYTVIHRAKSILARIILSKTQLVRPIPNTVVRASTYYLVITTLALGLAV